MVLNNLHIEGQISVKNNEIGKDLSEKSRCLDRCFKETGGFQYEKQR